MVVKRATYDISANGGGRETVAGYVGGDFGCRKEKYFWEFTHLPTGMKCSWYPPCERKTEALERLRELETRGSAALPEHMRALVDEARGWGGCDTPRRPPKKRTALDGLRARSRTKP